MKKNYFTIALVFCLTSMGIAQNTVTVDASAEQLGYATVLKPRWKICISENLGECQNYKP